MADSFSVGAYKVEGKVDYNMFAKQYGLQLIDGATEKRIERLAGPLHFTLRRKIFYAHRDLNWLLDEYEKGNKFYIYTGRAPSGPMHVGHLLPFLMVKWLQEKFDADVYIQIPDEEKYLVKNLKMPLEEIHRIAMDNVLDIIALGFNPKKTKIFYDTTYAGHMYKQAVRVAKHITYSMVKDAFGFTNENNVGTLFYTSMQAVPAFIKSVEEGKNVPCLIPLAIDQDVHFRIARDVIGKLGYYKPAIMHTKFLPALTGESKMSSSEENGDAIYLNDTPEEVKRKIGKAFTGQQATAELQKKYGGDPDKCVICQYYKYFFEPDDKRLEKILNAERKGTILAGEHKAALTKAINEFLAEHRKAKEKVRGRVKDFVVTD